jgi:hypothetical protein
MLALAMLFVKRIGRNHGQPRLVIWHQPALLGWPGRREPASRILKCRTFSGGYSGCAGLQRLLPLNLA